MEEHVPPSPPIHNVGGFLPFQEVWLFYRLKKCSSNNSLLLNIDSLYLPFLGVTESYLFSIGMELHQTLK